MSNHHPHGNQSACRRSMSLKGYDYTQAGAYFVTMVTQNRRCLFGEVKDEVMHPNDAGQMAIKWWQELSNKFNALELDEYVVMPNHFHAIVWITELDAHPGSGGTDVHAGAPEPDAHPGASLPKKGLSEIVQWFKTMTTNDYIRHVKQDEWVHLPGKLWQGGFYDHIIRNDIDLNHVRRYILENPLKWDLDQENPFQSASDPHK
jgi:putative transposase